MTDTELDLAGTTIMALLMRAQDRPPRPGSPSASPETSTLLRIAAWLQLVGAIYAFTVLSLWTAIRSDLAGHISPGESPAFHWARTHVTELLWLGLGYLLLVTALQHIGIRRAGRINSPGVRAPMRVELASLAILAATLLYRWDTLVPWGHTLLQASLLPQVFLGLRHSRGSAPNGSIHILDLPVRDQLLFLSLLFLFAALPVSLNPSWQRMHDYVELDSRLEIALSSIFPAVLSGITGLWFGIGMLVVLGGLRAFRIRLTGRVRWKDPIPFLPFLTISGLYVAVCLVSLAYAIAWEMNALHLTGAILPLFILLCGSGSILGYATFTRLASHAPGPCKQNAIGMMALSMAGALLWPITWALTRPGGSRWSWRLFLASALAGTLAFGYWIVVGNLFNPWFTVYSYLKGAMVKITAVMAAGIQIMILEEFRSARPRYVSGSGKRWIAIAAIVPLGFLPFALLEQYRETKVAVLQFNEFSMVDATYARALSDVLGLDGWVRLGQVPRPQQGHDPWPLPWTLEKRGPSLLPKDFNIVVIVVDALRGDVFGSAGYHRNLTPFMDRWAHDEAISFRRAYSQGGGTFAAFPFLVAGRSRFTLYGANLHHENLYFKLAQAEGIHKVMVVKDFGPRAIFPPDFPVIELGRTQPGDDRRSVPADEVFRWAQDAIAALGPRERFLAFLHLMDVHNDLWKKADGLDFGGSPRDLYDNNVSYVDRAFGRFVAWLQRRGIYHRTVILLTADHGEQFWEHGASLHGHTVYEEEIRIPLILLAHGIRARVEDIPAVAADMAPTIVELAGYTVRPPYDDPRMGISLVPLLLGESRSRYLDRDIVGRASFKHRYFLYRNWKWKLIYAAEFDLLQLFDTMSDLGERRNLLQEEPELAAELERELFGYLARVEGRSYRALLDNPPPQPDGRGVRIKAAAR